MNDQESSETGAGSESARSNPAGSESEAAGTEAAGTEPAAGVESAAGVDFPVAGDGRRSTSALGRAVIADALRRTDPAGAVGAERETNWRSGYLAHFRRVIEAGLTSRDAALAIAADGLGSLHGRMRAAAAGGEERDLGDLLDRKSTRLNSSHMSISYAVFCL